ncbi:MAG: hypothetical protein HQL06_15590 [Nitrospirae bacterium]|nr:hypothetical protein [Nitrospirota bacterium]
MFNIDKNRRFESDLALIENNYQTLLYDDEPILYTGTNKYGNRILGSSVEEDYESKIERYFHTIIDSKTYNDFLRKEISYLSIMQKGKSIFVIDKSFDSNTIQIYLINIDEIPVDYLPSVDSYCPEQELQSSFSYALKLKGKLADLHFAISKEVEKIQESFIELLQSSFNTCLKYFIQKPYIWITPYSEGSFKIQFVIKLTKNKQITLIQKDDMISNFVSDYLKYCLNDLPIEVDKIFAIEEDVVQFSKLICKYQNLYDTLKIKVPDEIKDILLNSIKDSVTLLDKLTEDIGDNYTYIELSNIEMNVGNDLEKTIGVIDSSFKHSIEKANKVIEKTSKVNEIVDDEPQEYIIHIYHLNTETGKGRAYIYNKNNDKVMSQPKIQIRDFESLEETKYTESLHLNKWINVKGVARIVDGKFRSIDIVFEPELNSLTSNTLCITDQHSTVLDSEVPENNHIEILL